VPAFTAYAVLDARRTNGHVSCLLYEGSAPVAVFASAPPYSLGPPRLSEPGGGVWTSQVDVSSWRAGCPTPSKALGWDPATEGIAAC